MRRENRDKPSHLCAQFKKKGCPTWRFKETASSPPRPGPRLARTRGPVRALLATGRGDVCVVLRGGSYPMTATYALVPADGGSGERLGC